MKRFGWRWPATAVLTLALLGCRFGAAAQERAAAESLPERRYLFAYFTGNGEDGLHLAWSADGYVWETLKKGQSFLKPEVGDPKLMRDPFLLKGPDGTFHLLWTMSPTGDSVGYATSTNLIDWSLQHTLPVMANEPATLNCWGPQAVWDEARRQFLIFWASTVTNRFTATLGQAEANFNNRLYCSRTKDFKTFTPGTLFYNPNFNAVDPTLLPVKGRVYLIFKDDTLRPLRKQLRLAVGEHLEGPFGVASPGFTRERVDGPTSLRMGEDCVVYFHDSQADRYGAVKTRDFLQWEEVSGRLSMPPGMRHGDAMEISGNILAGLRALDKPDQAPSTIAAELGVGAWIWTTNVADKQTCRLWHGFTVPRGALPTKAMLRITADNGYRVFLDGREIGRGGDWKYLTEYDLIWLCPPGRHVLAVEAINDAFDAGVMLGMKLEMANASSIEIKSDESWYIVPEEMFGWLTRKSPHASWFPAQVVGVAGHSPWQGSPGRPWPLQIIHTAPLAPPILHFWQQTWFLATLLAVCLGVAIICVRQAAQLSVHVRAERLLERERARIARDIHDDLGAGLTQLTLLGELVLREVPKEGETRSQVDALCGKARALLGTMDEIVWTVNPRRDTVTDFAAFVCQYVQEYLSSTTLRCRLDVAEDLPSTPLDLPARRNLLMAVKEAVRNAARHSGGSEVSLGIRVEQHSLEVLVEDNGNGFLPQTIRRGANGLGNMQKRLAEIGGSCAINSMRGAGCRVALILPLNAPQLARAWFFFAPFRRRSRTQGTETPL